MEIIYMKKKNWHENLTNKNKLNSQGTRELRVKVKIWFSFLYNSL